MAGLTKLNQLRFILYKTKLHIDDDDIPTPEECLEMSLSEDEIAESVGPHDPMYATFKIGARDWFELGCILENRE